MRKVQDILIAQLAHWGGFMNVNGENCRRFNECAAPVIAAMTEYSNEQINLNTGMFSVPVQRTNLKYFSSLAYCYTSQIKSRNFSVRDSIISRVN
jgi:hypothetical protein